MAWCCDPAGYCRSGNPTRAIASPSSRAVMAQRSVLAATPLGVALLVAAASGGGGEALASSAAYTCARTRHGSRSARILSTSPPIVCTRGSETTFTRVPSRSTRSPVSWPSGGGGSSGSGPPDGLSPGPVGRRGRDRPGASGGPPGGRLAASAASPSRDRRAGCRGSRRRRTSGARPGRRRRSRRRTGRAGRRSGRSSREPTRRRRWPGRWPHAGDDLVEVVELDRLERRRERRRAASGEGQHRVVGPAEGVGDPAADGASSPVSWLGGVVAEVEGGAVVGLADVAEALRVPRLHRDRAPLQIGRRDPQIDLVGVRRRGRVGDVRPGAWPG